MDTTERRLHPRFDLLAQVFVRSEDVDHVLAILNLSRGGALVDLGNEPRPRWLAVGRAVELRLFAPEGEPLIEARGKVVRIVETLDHRTFAVQFDAPLDEAVVRETLRAHGRPPPLPGT